MKFYDGEGGRPLCIVFYIGTQAAGTVKVVGVYGKIHRYTAGTVRATRYIITGASRGKHDIGKEKFTCPYTRKKKKNIL